MDRLLQHFDEPITDATGEVYVAFLYGRSRINGTWQGWLVFERRSDGRQFATPVETTQPTPEAVIRWAGGLSNAFFEGALRRALRGPIGLRRPGAVPPPLVEVGVDHATRDNRRAAIERDIIALFQRSGGDRMLARDIFSTLPYAGADIVRAIENLEKSSRAIVRRTEEGNDWVSLTSTGLRLLGLESPPLQS